MFFDIQTIFLLSYGFYGSKTLSLNVSVRVISTFFFHLSDAKKLISGKSTNFVSREPIMNAYRKGQPVTSKASLLCFCLTFLMLRKISVLPNNDIIIKALHGHSVLI